MSLSNLTLNELTDNNANRIFDEKKSSQDEIVEAKLNKYEGILRKLDNISRVHTNSQVRQK